MKICILVTVFSLTHEHYLVVNPALKTEDFALDITWILSWGDRFEKVRETVAHRGIVSIFQVLFLERNNNDHMNLVLLWLFLLFTWLSTWGM